MQAFSRTLVELYHLAESASLSTFPSEALRLFQQWAHFDGAVFGMGECEAASRPDLHIVQAHIHNRDEALLSEYAEVSAGDPVTGQFLAGLAGPLAVDCRDFYRPHRYRALNAYTRKHDMRHLMLFGDAPTASNTGRWVVLYRGNATPFHAEESNYLHAAWFHISRAIDINRAAALNRRDLQRTQRASALINRQGAIEAADPQFLALLQREWPSHSVKHLPHALLNELMRSGEYRGQSVDIRISPQESYWICEARPADKVSRLTPREFEVVRRYANGLSNKEIALELGISANTVRNQLSSAYGKLGVHDKAMLAQVLVFHENT